MIQSLFDSEDEKKEGNTVEEEITESPKNEVSVESQVTGNQKLSALELSENQPIAEESLAPVESEKEFSGENFQKVESPNLEFKPENISEFESENVFKEIEFGDNFLQLEKEVAKIEEEVQRESKEKSEQEAKTENTPIDENVVLTENKSNPENIEPKPTEQGIFTSALNKAQKEKQSSVPLENLLIVPNQTQAGFEERVSENQLDTSILGNENQGFILPNRIEPKPENSASNRSDDVFQSDYKPESKAQIIRNSGLAWSAGIAFFGSVIFLLILGWFADLLLGTSPWMAVGGVVLGSVVGFVQLFRLTSQILKDND